MSKNNFLSFILKGKKNKNKSDEQPENKPTPAPIVSSLHGEEKEVDPSKYITTEEVGGRSREMVLNYLGIKDVDNVQKDLDELMTPKDVHNVEFGVVFPSGLNIDEVQEWCDAVEDQISKYRQMIKKLKQDNEILLSEVLRVDAKAMEQKQNNLIGAQLNQSTSKAEKLQDKVVKLQLDKNKIENENKQLREQIRQGISPSDNPLIKENEELKRQLETINSQIDSTTAENNEKVANELQELRNENESLKQQLNAAQKTIKNDLATPQISEDDYDALKKQLEEKDNEIKVLKSDDAVANLEKQLKDSRAQLQKVLDVRTAAETNVDPSSTKHEKELEEEVKQLKIKIAALNDKTDESVAVLPKNPAEFNSQDKYEKIVMDSLKNHHSLRHVKKHLTKDDINKMKDGEKKATLSLGVKNNNDINNENKKDTPSKPQSSFDSLLKEMNED